MAAEWMRARLRRRMQYFPAGAMHDPFRPFS
jgi:hypothetical protein